MVVLIGVRLSVYLVGLLAVCEREGCYYYVNGIYLYVQNCFFLKGEEQILLSLQEYPLWMVNLLVVPIWGALQMVLLVCL